MRAIIYLSVCILAAACVERPAAPAPPAPLDAQVVVAPVPLAAAEPAQSPSAAPSRPAWSPEMRDALCAKAHALWEDESDLAGCVESLAAGFRESIPRAALADFDHACIKLWLPILLKRTRELGTIAAPSRWKFIADLTGDPRFRKKSDNLAARQERESVHLRAEEEKMRQEDVTRKQERGVAARGVSMYLRQNGFDGAVAWTENAQATKLFISHEDMNRQVIAGLILGGLFVELKRLGFAEVEFSNGKMFGHQAWTYTVR